jgi:hypothetical protein
MDRGKGKSLSIARKASDGERSLVGMTIKEALTFVEEHGVVLESAPGPVPNLAEQIAAENLRGSWWSHRRARDIFVTTRAVRDSGEVLVCRLIEGKVTYVHRRLLPALVRMAGRIPKAQLAAIREVHLESGKYKVEETPFPYWVPEDVMCQAQELTQDQAARMLKSSVPVLSGPR